MDYGVSWSDSAGLSLTEAGILNAPEVAESAIYRYTCKEVVFIVHMNVWGQTGWLWFFVVCYSRVQKAQG
jgi:hypothetical protein